ncbi:MAG: hypothetical protein AAGK05_16065, partial [Pseudomonadota bacterium]
FDSFTLLERVEISVLVSCDVIAREHLDSVLASDWLPWPYINGGLDELRRHTTIRVPKFPAGGVNTRRGQTR